MDLAIGAVLAAVIGVGATFVGFDRERGFYPTVMIVIASYYVLFAAIGATGGTLAAETLLMAPFVGATVAGFRTSPWIVVSALAAHGVLDTVHAGLLANPGVPPWWPGFCLGFDVVAACWLAILLVRRGKSNRA